MKTWQFFIMLSVLLSIAAGVANNPFSEIGFDLLSVGCVLYGFLNAWANHG